MHPFVKILSFIMLLFLMSFLSHQMLWLLCISVCGFAAKLQFNKFIRVVKRMRWLFISIFFIYALGTPGEYIQNVPANFPLTYEGCNLGVLQIVKLLIALAGLSILFATSSIEHLMVGLYILLSPLKLLRFNVERFTARLLLTLDYVEALAIKGNFSFHQLDELHSATESLQDKKVIILQSPAFNRIDQLLIITIMTTALTLAVFKVFS